MENSYSQQDIKALKERAEAGDADAQELYGIAFDEGNGVDMNQEAAVKWYEQAANQGKLISQANIGWAYLSGRVNGEPDIEKGLAFLESAMEGGYPSAYGSMAVAYFGGLGVEKDLDKAVSLARKAYEEGGRNRDGMILAETLLHRDEDRVDMSEVIAIYQSVAADESEDPATRQQAEERLRDFAEPEELNELIDAFENFKNGEGLEEIETSFREAAREINERSASERLLPSELIEAYIDMFCSTQPHWYETYADRGGNASTSGIDFNYDARTVIVEGEEIAYLVSDQDGKVQKLHPAYNLEDDSIGETEGAVVMSLANVDDNFAMVRYIPGVDGYPYPIWTGDEDLSIDPALLEAIDDSLTSIQVDAGVYHEAGGIIYRMAWEIQAVMKEEDFTVSDISDDLPEVLEPLKDHIAALQAEHDEAWEDEDEDENNAAYDADSEEKTGFAVRQQMLSTAMLVLFHTVCRAVEENDVGSFPFYVLCGDKEALGILHEDGEIDNLEDGYELAAEVFDQTPKGFTLDAGGFLGFTLQLVPVPQGDPGLR